MCNNDCNNCPRQICECRPGILKNNKYKQALDEIEKYVLNNSNFDESDKITSNTSAYDILEIINKAKD